MISGTSLGGATDINGEYFILNVPAGTYTVVASYIGYTKVSIENVVVNTGRTTQINFKLNSETIEQEEIVITASRPPVEVDRTSSEQIISSNEINKTFDKNNSGTSRNSSWCL